MIVFETLYPLSWLIGIFSGALLWFCLRGLRGEALFWRVLAMVFFLLAFLQPQKINEESEPIPNIIAIIRDDSPSLRIPARAERQEESWQNILAKLDQSQTETRHYILSENQEKGGTYLAPLLNQIRRDIPSQRLGGILLLSDGQIHDLSAAAQNWTDDIPLHLLLTPDREEHDRRLEILGAPRFGKLGDTISLSLVAHDNKPQTAPMALHIIGPDGREDIRQIPSNQKQILNFRLTHAGPNEIGLKLAASDDEISLVNNQHLVKIEALQDKLKVLLVTGQPQPGVRMWRQMLKSDPAIDLVHFTILRAPHQFDPTPATEMALIPFPVDQLFGEALPDFDLIIFDGFRHPYFLENHHLQAIADYVQKGGALLDVSSAALPQIEDHAAFWRQTPIQKILPVTVTGKFIHEKVKPIIAPQMKFHPVLKNLPLQDWGRFDEFEKSSTPQKAQTLLTVQDQGKNYPLLALAHQGEGRVAQLLSSQIWYWQKGIDGGGDALGFARQIVQWLLKNPRFDENQIDAHFQGNKLILTQAVLTDSSDANLKIILPDGQEKDTTLRAQPQGYFQTTITPAPIGLYQIKRNQENYLAPHPDLNKEEWQRLLPDIAALHALSDNAFIWRWADPSSKLSFETTRGNDFTGSTKIWLKDHAQKRIKARQMQPFLPVFFYLLLGGFCLLLSWVRTR